MRFRDPTVTVALDAMELTFAKTLGEERHRRSVARGGVNAWGGAHGPEVDVVGAAAEMAVCKWAGIYFVPTIDTFGQADILPDVQVRCRRRHDRQLFVRARDTDSHRYLLVTSETAGQYVLRGWIYGRDGKVAAWLKDYGEKRQPAYFVPNQALRPLGELLL